MNFWRKKIYVTSKNDLKTGLGALNPSFEGFNFFLKCGWTCPHEKPFFSLQRSSDNPIPASTEVVCCPDGLVVIKRRVPFSRISWALIPTRLVNLLTIWVFTSAHEISCHEENFFCCSAHETSDYETSFWCLLTKQVFSSVHVLTKRVPNLWPN